MHDARLGVVEGQNVIGLELDLDEATGEDSFVEFELDLDEETETSSRA